MARHMYIRVRLSEDERRLLDSHSEQLGMTISDYIRFLTSLPIELVAGERARAANAPLAIDILTYPRLFVESKRWGSNYNQGVRALNTLARRFETASYRSGKGSEEIFKLCERAELFLKRGAEGMEEVVRVAKTLEERVAVRAVFKNR